MNKCDILTTALREKINVIDIGAADELDDCFTGCAPIFSFIGFEPEEQAYQQLLTDNRYKKIYNAALYCEKKEIDFYITRKAQCSSLYLPNEKFLSQFDDVARWDVIRKANIQTHCLDDFAEENDVDFIKLDTQGSEIDILKGGENMLKKCFGIRLEVEFQSVYCEQPLFRDVDLYMSQIGFALYDFPRTVRWSRNESGRLPRKNISQIIFSDAVYLRTDNFDLYLQQFSEHEKQRKVEKYIGFLISQDYFDLASSILNEYSTFVRTTFCENIKDYLSSFERPVTADHSGKNQGRIKKTRLFLKTLASKLLSK